MKIYPYFSVYQHKLIMNDNTLITRKFIVLKDENHKIITFTNFHKYVLPKNKKSKRISSNGGARFDFIVKFLNYAFFNKYRIESLEMITVSIIKEFLEDYGLGRLPNDNKKRTKATVEQCTSAIMDFIVSLIKDKNVDLQIEKEDLFKTKKIYRQGRIIEQNIPVFDIYYLNDKKKIFRDIPNKVFEIFLSYFLNNYTELVMLIALSAFAGLRPSEACNVRREDSSLGAGIRFGFLDGEIYKISIDLTDTKNLRSDLKPVGGIKKYRTQEVPSLFINAFYECYLHYMHFLEGKKYETAYGALSLNKRGKAITYDNYYRNFRKIVKEEIIPILLNNDDPEAVFYGHLLLENNISPHIFRHWYSVQLVLNGYSIHELMNARGDSSPTSSLVYLQNKGDLEKQYKKVNTEIFGYLNWLAERKIHD